MWYNSSSKRCDSSDNISIARRDENRHSRSRTDSRSHYAGICLLFTPNCTKLRVKRIPGCFAAGSAAVTRRQSLPDCVHQFRSRLCLPSDAMSTWRLTTALHRRSSHSRFSFVALLSVDSSFCPTAVRACWSPASNYTRHRQAPRPPSQNYGNHYSCTTILYKIARWCNLETAQKVGYRNVHRGCTSCYIQYDEWVKI